MSVWGADENVRMSHDLFELDELQIAEKENKKDFSKGDNL